MSKKLNVLATRTKNIQIKSNIRDDDIAFPLYSQDSKATQIFFVTYVKCLIMCQKFFYRKLMTSVFLLMTS